MQSACPYYDHAPVAIGSYHLHFMMRVGVHIPALQNQMSRTWRDNLVLTIWNGTLLSSLLQVPWLPLSNSLLPSSSFTEVGMALVLSLAAIFGRLVVRFL